MAYSGWQAGPVPMQKVDEVLEELRDRIKAMDRFYEGVHYVDRAVVLAKAREVGDAGEG